MENNKQVRLNQFQIRCAVVRVREVNKITLSGGDNEGVTPVPIPNTEVKPFSADGTWLETARESRSLPDSIFLSSSMAEHSAVNRRVVGSSPTWGAKSTAQMSGIFLFPRWNLNKLSFRQTASARALLRPIRVLNRRTGSLERSHCSFRTRNSLHFGCADSTLC